MLFVAVSLLDAYKFALFDRDFSPSTLQQRQRSVLRFFFFFVHCCCFFCALFCLGRLHICTANTSYTRKLCAEIMLRHIHFIFYVPILQFRYTICYDAPHYPPASIHDAQLNGVSCFFVFDATLTRLFGTRGNLSFSWCRLALWLHCTTIVSLDKAFIYLSTPNTHTNQATLYYVYTFAWFHLIGEFITLGEQTWSVRVRNTNAQQCTLCSMRLPRRHPPRNYIVT